MQLRGSKELLTYLNDCDLLIVGSGFYGLTVAEIASREFNLNCVIVEKRSHIGGNAYSYFESETNIEVHKYGSHLFHTNSENIYNYVRKFTSFNNYEHRVKAINDKIIYTLPFNLHTLNQVYGIFFDPKSAASLVDNFSNRYGGVNSEDAELSFETKALALVGPEIYRLLIEGYTWKQWQRSPSELPASIISRLPVRFNFDDRYFSDKYQGLPSAGYAKWFDNMLQNQRISVFLDLDYFQIPKVARSIPTIYTGGLDRFFDYKLGQLNWRTLDFETEALNTDDFQGTSVMNYTNRDIPFTRIHEFKHLHPEREYFKGTTIISREFSRSASRDDEPYYPVNSFEDRQLLKKYRRLADQEKLVHFGGRLGTYQYLDMHMAIGSALQFMASSFINWFRHAQYLCKGEIS